MKGFAVNGNEAEARIAPGVGVQNAGDFSRLWVESLRVSGAEAVKGELSRRPHTFRSRKLVAGLEAGAASRQRWRPIRRRYFDRLPRTRAPSFQVEDARSWGTHHCGCRRVSMLSMRSSRA